MKNNHIIQSFILAFLSLSAIANNEKQGLADLKFEHLRINVPNKEDTARWYVDHVGLEIIAVERKDRIYVADKDHNFMFEFTSIPHIKNKYFDVHLDALHIAFEGQKSIESVAGGMLANQGVQEGITYRNEIGDYVINVRDPNGFVAQLIHRVNPFYSKPVKSDIRFEHLAFNTPDQKTAALWFIEFMELEIPWSKDIDVKQNQFRNYRVPYVGDASRSMSFELFGKSDVDATFAKMKHEECHIAFASTDPEKVANQMIYGGAKMIGELQKDSNGDVFIDLVDPYGFPIRLIKRVIPILIKNP